MLAAALLLQSCNASYHVLAKVIGGRLAFVPVDRDHKCISIISVTMMGPRDANPAIDEITDPAKRAEAIDRVRIAWAADGVSNTCKAHYPIFYGSALPDMPVTHPPKKLRTGVAYSIAVGGPNGIGGGGCFRMTKEGKAENLPDRSCSYREPPPPPMPPAPVPVVTAPARAQADPQSLIGPTDYPESSIRLGEQGAVGFALDVGEDGRVQGCTITRNSPSATLDGLTCRLMRSRARFTPALDSQGNPAPSRVEQEVVWRLPAGAAADARPEVKEWGNGMVSNSAPPPVVTVSIAPPPVVDGSIAPIRPEPIMAIPQDGPGKADLSVWDPRTNAIRTLRRYRSIPVCQRAMAKLKLRPGQKAYCTIAPKRHLNLDIH